MQHMRSAFANYSAVDASFSGPDPKVNGVWKAMGPSSAGAARLTANYYDQFKA